MKKIAIIGATGSIGTNALDVIKSHRDKFSVSALIAHRNHALLAQLAHEFSPAYLALMDPQAEKSLREIYHGDAKIFSGADGVDECLRVCGADFCISAASGIAGLLPTLTAIDCGMDIGLANKESLVAAGVIIMPLVAAKKIKLLPIDSEHSALQQCLCAGNNHEIARIIITGSGGAFRDWDIAQLSRATAAQALAHPTWKMGEKITIDSATLANKALEVIEAHHLFNIDYAKIDVLLHPQSIIHGAVEFIDGALIAQLATPDMRLPILSALSIPERLPNNVERLTLEKLSMLTFSAPDLAKYPLLKIGIDAGKRGGLLPTAFSSANEAAVKLFLQHKISYWEIVKRVEKAIASTPNLPVTIDSILLCDQEARKMVNCE